MPDLNADLYKKLFLARTCEERIREDYPEDGMKTPMHMSFGEEAIVVGVCHALEPGDQIFTSYRSHAAYLAKTADTDGFFAELYAKATSNVKGRGGSMHLCCPERGFLGTSAIVASQIPVAVGAAHANKILGNGKIVAVFFGDGAVDEGVFWESVNVACLMQLPVLFVCEDNGLAVHTPISARRGYDSLTEMVSGFRCHVLASDSRDVETIHRLTLEAITRMRCDSRPGFLELKYFRFLEHVGIASDAEDAYRPKTETGPWSLVDPVSFQRAKLLSRGLTEAEIRVMEDETRQGIAQSIDRAKRAPFSPIGEAGGGVFP